MESIRVTAKTEIGADEAAFFDAHILVLLDPELLTSIEDKIKANKVNAEYARNYYNDTEIYQTLLYRNEREETLYRSNLQSLNFIRWHEYAMDALPLVGSRAKGIEKFIEQIGFTRD